MHKLAKGLKKKKKPKKGKKGAEEEEFDPEELERYRRERAEAQEKAATESSEGGCENSQIEKIDGAGSDEWQKFQALTAGVDSILKKTQGDLDRIKSTSFFQRKAPVEDEKHKRQKEAEAFEEEARIKAKRWVGFDKEGNPIEKETHDSEADEDIGSEESRKKGEKSTGKKTEKFSLNEEGFADVPDDDDEPDDSADEDIFDTTYVDVLQNIDVQLAYIPDSPTQDELGDDPFDTTNADKVLKTVDKKGNKLVSLGNAVEVLSGRIDHVSTCKISRPRKNRNQDLLLDDTDIDPVDSNLTESTETFEIQKTLLDEDTDFPDIPIDLTNLPAVLPRPVTPITSVNHKETIKESIPLDISEFEILKEKTLLEEIPDLDDAEFDLHGDEDLGHLDEIDDPFGTKDTEEVNFESQIIEAAFEVASFVNEEDPFDTTFADNILPGKTELRFIEKELEELPSNEVSISLTDPSGLRRDYETGLLSSDPSSRTNVDKQLNENQDLLGGSCTDLTQLTEKPIEPDDEITYVDPFDTSGIREIPPGQTELKYLEQELLGEKQKIIKSDSLDDEDFDPRKEEEVIESRTDLPIRPGPPPRPKQPNNQQRINFQVNFEPEESSQEQGETFVGQRGRKPSRPEILGLGTGKSVAFELPTPSKRPDLLQTSDEEKSISSKPLTPYYSEKSLDGEFPEVENNEESIDVDPFDTSFVGKVAPGKTELKLIETELLTRQESRLKHSTSDYDFDPRSGIDEDSEIVIGRRQSDFAGSSIRSKILCVKESESSLIEENEIVTRQNIFEVNEAAHKRKNETKRQESLLDAEVEVDAKPLTPSIERNVSEKFDEISYSDPFDTSIATNILPGKAELKLLENELSQLPTEVQKVRINRIDLDKISARPSITEDEDDFDPRADETKITKDFLSIDGQDPGDKILTPLNESDIIIDNEDPFDTSFASIGPGKTELKLLESELMDK